MRRIALLSLLLAGALAGPAHAGPLKEECMGVEPRLGGPCRGAEVIATQVSASCRYAGLLPEEQCATPVTPRVSKRLIREYEDSWLHRTLSFQYELAAPLPLVNAPWIGTHNSFNSASEPFTVSGMDSNQQVSLTDQLRMDVRSLELDAHYVPGAGGGRTPVLCHGRGSGELHAGCTTERPMAERIDEIAGWLERHPRQVLLLYVEDHLEGVEGHDAAARILRDRLGSMIYAPGGDGAACREMPLDLSVARVRRGGAQVILLGSCGEGAQWRQLSFGDAERRANETGGDTAFGPYPSCDPARSQAFYDQRFVRYFEDSTGLSAGTAFAAGEPPQEGLTPEKTAAMIRCGVDLFGFDQLLPDDGRLAALAWSWAPDEPRPGAGRCVVIGADARFRAERCKDRHAFACRDAAGRWSVDRKVARQKARRRKAARRKARRSRCRGATFAVPRRGVEAQRLADAMEAAGVETAWVRLTT